MLDGMIDYVRVYVTIEDASEPYSANVTIIIGGNNAVKDLCCLIYVKLKLYLWGVGGACL